MKVIDAFTGRSVQKGDVLPHPDGYSYKVIDIDPGIFKASITIAALGGVSRTVPLAVRWTHPRFFLQHVAFIPT